MFVINSLKFYLVPNLDEQYKNEISLILKEIEDTKNRENIYISSQLALDLANLCNNEKGISFYNYLLNKEQEIGYRKVCPIRKEISFLDKLEEALKPFGLKGERQYRVFNYRIDFYISSLNIAIEYDENGHSGYSYEKHDERQRKIENKLSCCFIRVTDYKTDEYNIGYIIKRIFSITE